MKQKTLLKHLFLLFALVIGGVGNAWGADEVHYTLDGTKTGGTQDYATASEIVQNDMTWKVTGNTTMNPWRIGGKGITNQDRDVYSATAMDAAITKIELGIGAMNITANSVKLIVASDADFTEQLDEITKTSGIAENSTLTFEPTSGTEWANGSYYKFVYNVTNSGNSNKYISLSSAKFYKEAADKTLTSIELSGTYPTSFYVNDEFSHEGMTVTANYDDESTKDVTSSATFSGYNMASAGAQTVTVSYTENEVTKTANYGITVNTPATYNVTYYVDGVQTVLADQVEGTVLNTILPTPTTEKAGYYFKGWLTTTLDATDTEPSYYDISQALNSDLTLYAVFAKLTGELPKTDNLTREKTRVTKNATNYATWTGVSDESDAVYAGNSAGGNDAIQLRSSSNSGIISTTSGGTLKKVTVIWNSNTGDRTLDIYGKNSAYSETSDLYNGSSSIQGTKLGSIVKGASTELTITGDYTYIGLRSNNGAMYLDNIAIDWQNGEPATYSNYCTTITAKSSAGLAIDPTEIEMYINDTDKTITVTTAAGYDGEISVVSSDDNHLVADNSGDEKVVELLADAAGEYTVTIKASETAAYESAQVVCNVTVSKNPSEAAFAVNAPTIDLAENTTYTQAATTAAGYNGVVTYALSDNTCGASIEGTTVTVTQKGQVTVTATAPATATYAESTATYTLKVTDVTNQDLEVESNLNYNVIGTTNGGNTDSFEINIDGVTMSVDKGTGNAPRGDDTYIRIYNKNVMTFTAPTGFVLTDIEFTRPSASADWKDGMSANVGSYDDAEGTTTKTWTGTTTEVTFTPGGTHRIASVAITLAPGTKVTNAKYATYVTVKHTDFASSTGVTAYKVTNADDKITLVEIDEAPKGTPVVIAAEEDTYALEVAASEPAAVTGNILRVSDGSIVGDYETDGVDYISTYYVLGKNGSWVGFAPLANGVTLPKGKAYIHDNDWTDSAAKAFLPFVIDDETTGINSIENGKLNIEGAYNLNGQKVSGNYKGIVIINGKKYLNK